MGAEANIRQISPSASNRRLRESWHNDLFDRSWSRERLQANRIQPDTQRQQL